MIDDFNLAYIVTPGSFIDFIDGVVPVLQKRGLMQREYQEGTLREKLQGCWSRQTYVNPIQLRIIEQGEQR